MILNELVFLGYIFVVSSGALLALRFGKEGLVGFICVQAVLVNLFVTKQITLFGFTATASDALAVGITLSLNLLQEYFQKPAAIKAIWVSFYCALFYTVLSLLHITYIPALTDTSSTLFQTLLAPMPRLVGASLVTYLIVQFTDATLYGLLKSFFKDHYFVARNYATLALTQLLDTILFSFLGLYGLNESFSQISTLIDIIVVSYIIKLVVIFIAVPYVRLARTFKLVV